MDLRKTAFAVLPTALLGCGGGNTCLPYVAPSFNVSIVDAATSESAGCGATVELLDAEGQIIDVGSYAGEPCVQPDRLFHVGMNNSGFLIVRVTKEGYETWVSDPIEVTYLEKDCHVLTLDIVAQLEPSS